MSGVPVTIVQLPAVTPDAADSLPLWDQSAGLTGRSTVTGMGNVFALLTGAVFTGTVNSTDILGVLKNDNGAGGGGRVVANRNPNASTPAAGSFSSQNVNGGSVRLWADASNIWRTATSDPTFATDTGGTVVGAQTSSLDQKDVAGDPLPPDEILALIAEGAAAVRRFQYKAVTWIDEVTGETMTGARPSGGEEFSGVVVDYAGRYGTDVDEAHPNGKSLNTINVTGDLLIAVNYLAGRVAELEARLETAVAAIAGTLTNFEEPPAEGAR